MALWAILLKDEEDFGLDWCDPIEADSAEEAVALANAQPRQAHHGEEPPALMAVLEEVHKHNRQGLTLVDPGLLFDLCTSSRAHVSKHAAGQQRKPKPRKPQKRWS